MHTSGSERAGACACTRLCAGAQCVGVFVCLCVCVCVCVCVCTCHNQTSSWLHLPDGLSALRMPGCSTNGHVSIELIYS